MRIIRLTPLALLFVALTAAAAFAQGARPAGQTPPAGGAPAAVPDAKIALINTNAFYDDKAGIIRLNKALDNVEREFEPKRVELQQVQQDMIKRQDDIQKQAALLDQPNSPVRREDLQAKADTLAQMKKDFDRKVQDTQESFKKRTGEVQAPIIQDIVKALDVFAKQRGITLTLDASKMPEAVMTVMPSVDITDAFIKEYNSRNPATASLAKPQ